MSLLKIMVFIFLSFSTFNYALEKDRLVSFLKEYDASEEKYSGKIAFAIENEYPDIAEFLLLKGEKSNIYAKTSTHPLPNGKFVSIKHPLITSIKKGYEEAALLMIELGAGNTAEEYTIEYLRIDRPNGTFRTDMIETDRSNAMSIAIEENSYELVLSLIDHGFDVNNNKSLGTKMTGSNFTDKSICMTPLVHSIIKKNQDIADLLLDCGADVEKVSLAPCLFENSNGYQFRFVGTALQKAVDDNFIEGVHLLLNHQANPLTGSPSPLENAIIKGYTDIVDVLFNEIINDTPKQ